MNEERPAHPAYGDEQWQTRVDLAACYRLVAHYGWDDLIFTHISARVPGAEDQFLINPFGLLFEEITASNLIVVDTQSNKISDSPHPVNAAGFTIHSAVHAARHEVGCVIHTHTRAGCAVAAQRDGLLPLSQIASLALCSIGYHDYEGVALDDDEKPRLVADLGDNVNLILRNHGLLTVGGTIADAFLAMYALETACQIQVQAQAGGVPLVHVPTRIVEGTRAQADQLLKGLGGLMAWPALLRKLDRIDPGYRE